MARRSFVGRIGRALRNLVAPSPRERPAPQPPSPPEPPRPPTRRDYRDIWRNERGTGHYQAHLETFHELIDPIESDPDEQLMLWESYVKHMVKGEGTFRRNSSSNMFWRDSGIDPRDFDWQMWRAAMGYTSKRRSRTA